MPLGQVVTLQRGFDLPYRLRRSGSIPIVTSSGITDTHDTAQVQGPGVITGRYGTIGEVFFVSSDFWPHNTTLYVRDFKGNDPLFISYLLRMIDFASHSGKSGVPGVNRNDLHQLRVRVPLRSEQRAIAVALSDVDGLIGALDTLISKKRAIKLAAMQQLLTGRMRLPMFAAKGVVYKTTALGSIPNDWTISKIGEIGSIRTGPFGSSLHERDYVRDGTPIITVEHLGEYGILHSAVPMVSECDRRRLRAYSLQEGDIVFSRVGSVDRNALVSCVEAGWLFSGRLLRIRADQTLVSPAFLSYQFHHEEFKMRVRSIAVGQTMASLNTRLISDVDVILPGVLEQKAIAAILFAMDSETIALERRRDKMKAIKQGMMQALLTGRIRLVKPGAQE